MGERFLQVPPGRRQLGHEPEVPAHVALDLAVLRIRAQHLLVEGERPRDMRGGLVELPLAVERGREVGVAVRLVAACHEIRRCEGQPLLRGLERAREVPGGFGQTARDAQRPTQVPVDQVQPAQRFLVGGARLSFRFPDGERAALVVLRLDTVARS